MKHCGSCKHMGFRVAGALFGYCQLSHEGLSRNTPACSRWTAGGEVSFGRKVFLWLFAAVLFLVLGFAMGRAVLTAHAADGKSFTPAAKPDLSWSLLDEKPGKDGKVWVRIFGAPKAALDALKAVSVAPVEEPQSK